MTEILTSAQMRAAERAAIDSGAVSGRVLMDRAGAIVLDAVAQAWPVLAKRRGLARILCGPGNNGGDGFVIARLLQAQGWKVEVVTFGDPARLPPDARANHTRLGVLVTDGQTAPATAFAGDLSVDAVFGTGLARPISDPALIAWLTEHAHYGEAGGATVAVDVPSGLDADSGRVLTGEAGAICARSRLTVTFHRAKLGHYLAEGPEWCGALTIGDIGL